MRYPNDRFSAFLAKDAVGDLPRQIRSAAMPAAVFLALTAAAASAAELPLSGVFGTGPGCAMINRVQPVPAGERTVLQPERLMFEGANCSYTTVVDEGDTADGHTWQAAVSCDAGHDEDPARSSVRVTEATAGDVVVVELLDGRGPTGDFGSCAVSP